MAKPPRSEFRLFWTVYTFVFVRFSLSFFLLHLTKLDSIFREVR
uniref:Uncharacterized protein n=1 Tax=Rhizophora mucronata TaxID=61149 RepID=A0A2P2PB63_RHIMU